MRSFQSGEVRSNSTQIGRDYSNLLFPFFLSVCLNMDMYMDMDSITIVIRLVVGV